MHFYTILLIKSWALLLLLILSDIYLLNDVVEEVELLHTAAGLWALANFIATPIWIVWAVVTL